MRQEHSQDLLTWPLVSSHGARPHDGHLAVERPWGSMLLRSSEPLAGGWWRLRSTGPRALEIELRRVGSATTRMIRLAPGGASSLLLEAGEHEARIWSGPSPGRFAAALTLRPLPAALGPLIRAARAIRLLTRAGPRAVWARLTGGDPPPIRRRRRRAAFRPVSDPAALVAEAFAANPDWQALYGDEIVAGRYDARPAWDEDLALRAAYAGRAVFFRDGRAVDDPVRAHAGLLEIARRHGPGAIGRLPLPLGRRGGGEPDLPRLQSVIQEHLRLTGQDDGEVRARDDGLGLDIRRTPARWPSVSLVIPTRDRAALIDGCLTSVFELTDYPAFEVVVVDNGSREPDAVAALARWGRHERVRVLRRDEPFNFARLCNAGVEAAGGEVLVLLNDDILAIEPGWLKALAGEAIRPSIGAVGALLQYRDGTVQHAGLALGVFGHAGHPWRGLPLDVCREPRVLLAGGRAAVTGACLAARRDAWAAVDGMDEDAFAVTFNDVDLCLRLARQGLKTLYQPAARLIHLESQTRRPDHHPQNVARRDREAQAFLERWAEVVTNDPYYSPALARSDESGEPR